MQHGHVAYGCGSYTELLCTGPRWPLEIGHARPTLSLTTLIADRPVHYPLHPHPSSVNKTIEVGFIVYFVVCSHTQ